MHFVVSELRPADSLALVSFSEEVTVDMPLGRVTPAGRRAASAAIDKLFPGGGTSLARGLSAGVAQLSAGGALGGGVRGSVG